MWSLPKQLVGKNKNRTQGQAYHRRDRWLFLSVVALSVIGLLSVYESSVSLALRDFSNQYYYLKEQLQWFVLGFILMVSISYVDYRKLFPLALPLLIISMILLLAVFLPQVGVKAYGAHRWIDLGFINFQPAEITKLTFILYLAAWLSAAEQKRLLAFFLLLFMIVGLVVIEPDVGTALTLLLTGLFMYFFSGAPMVHFLITGPILLVATLLTIFVAPYRVRRLMTFLNPESDPLGASYQIHQILLALGSGSWFGVGIGKSRQKYAYLPEANTDSIFAIIGEEIGFVGGAMVIGLILFIIWRGFRIAQRTVDPFGKALALGITSWIAVQSIINLGSTVALIPLTGVPLPFVSYGGSSLIILFCAIGILLNISKHR